MLWAGLPGAFTLPRVNNLKFPGGGNFPNRFGKCGLLSRVGRMAFRPGARQTGEVTTGRAPVTRVGASANVRLSPDFFRFTPSFGHSGQGWECLKLTQSSHELAERDRAQVAHRPARGADQIGAKVVRQGRYITLQLRLVGGAIWEIAV